MLSTFPKNKGKNLKTGVCLIWDLEIRRRRSKDLDIDFDPDQINAEPDPQDAERDREDPDNLLRGVFIPTGAPVLDQNFNVFVHDRGGAVHDDSVEDDSNFQEEGICF